MTVHENDGIDSSPGTSYTFDISTHKLTPCGIEGNLCIDGLEMQLLHVY